MSAKDEKFYKKKIIICWLYFMIYNVCVFCYLGQVAGLQACDHPHALRLPDVDLHFPPQFRPYSGAAAETLDARRPVRRYGTAWRGVALALSPVLVCRKPAKTVGLGDAISATGLIHSQYSPPPHHS
jgi:hypothetical protein